MFDRDHVEDGAREESAVLHVFNDGKLTEGGEILKIAMLLEEGQNLIDALEVVEGLGFLCSEAGEEVVFEAEDPACADHRRVGDHLEIARQVDDRIGRRSGAEPKSFVRSDSNETEETGVGIDPGRAGGSGMGRALFMRVDAGPDALEGTDDGGSG